MFFKLSGYNLIYSLQERVMQTRYAERSKEGYINANIYKSCFYTQTEVKEFLILNCTVRECLECIILSNFFRLNYCISF